MKNTQENDNLISTKPSHNITIENEPVACFNEHRTLLESLEAADVEVHYHCRDGFCGACRITLKKGQILYPNGEPLAYVGENEILPCCCVPVSDIDIVLE